MLSIYLYNVSKDHLNLNNLHDINQSAYRSNIFTETALLRVQNDISEALDRKRVVVLAMLDMSSAFNIDHGIIMLNAHGVFNIYLVLLLKPWV